VREHLLGELAPRIVADVLCQNPAQQRAVAYDHEADREYEQVSKCSVINGLAKFVFRSGHVVQESGICQCGSQRRRAPETLAAQPAG
jgi:hypothetical protein